METIQMTFNQSKTINAVLHITEKLKRKDFHKIFKILYFSDREHLVQYGRSITGDRYIAMSDDPIPSHLYDILKSVRGDGFFKDTGTFSKYFSVVDWNLIVLKEKVDLNELSVTDLQFINEAIDRYGDMCIKYLTEQTLLANLSNGN